MSRTFSTLYNNVGQTIDVGPGSVDGTDTLATGGVIQGGVIADAGSGLALQGGTLDGVTYDGTLDLSVDNASVYIADGITLDDFAGTGPGTINLTGNNAYLYTVGATTLDHATLDIGNSAGFAFLYAQSGVLTLGANLTVNQTGAFVQVQGTGTIDNKTTLSVTVAGGVFSVGADTFINDGTFAVSNGANNVNLSPGTLTNNGLIKVSGAGSVLNGIATVFDNSGSITVGAGATADLGGSTSFSNTGSITLAAGSTGYLGSNGNAFAPGHLAVANGATIHLAGNETEAALAAFAVAGDTIYIDGTLDNTGATLAVGPGSPLGTIILTGDIKGGTIADAASGIVLQGGTLDGVTYDGTLDLSADNASVFVADGITVKNAAGTGPGTINLTGNNAHLYTVGATTLDNATLDLGNAAGFAFLYAQSGVLTLGANLTVSQTGPLVQVQGSGTIDNRTTVSATASGGVFFVGVDSFINDGTFAVSNGASNVVLSPSTLINNGLFSVSGVGSQFLIDTPAAGSGSARIGFGATVELQTSFAQHVAFAGAGGVLALDAPGDLTGTIDGSVGGDTIDFVGVSVDNATLLNNVLSVTVAGTPYTYQLSSSPNGGVTTKPDTANGTDVVIACYLAGTRISTDSGERPVETLAIGDRVVTRRGICEPIKWIGRRAYAGRFAAGSRMLLPIRIKAGALKEGVPRRDLLVSPQHAMLIDGVLIPAGRLVNGVSVVQEEAEADIHYVHLELERHAAILAEGAWAETFVDDDSRAVFQNAAEYEAMYPEETRAAVAFCARRVEDGPELAAAWARIAGRCGLGAGPTGALHGAIEHLAGGAVHGWVGDLTRPEMPVEIEVLVDDRTIGRTLANRPRADLERAGIGDGRRGFILPLPKDHAAAGRVVTVRRCQDGAELSRRVA